MTSPSSTRRSGHPLGLVDGSGRQADVAAGVHHGDGVAVAARNLTATKRRRWQRGPALATDQNPNIRIEVAAQHPLLVISSGTRSMPERTTRMAMYAQMLRTERSTPRRHD